jgi:hypothetical protein
LLDAEAVLFRRARLAGNHVGFPDLAAGGQVECDNAAAESAAFIEGIEGRTFFARSDGNVGTVVMDLDPTSNAPGRVIIDSAFSEEPAVGGIEGVDVSAAIAEQDYIAIGERGND